MLSDNTVHKKPPLKQERLTKSLFIGRRISSIDHKESYEAWREFLSELKSRGLQSPKLVISDAHKGLKKAIEKEFIGTSWQRCTVHFKRNIIETLPKKGMAEVIVDLKRIFEAVKVEDARFFRNEFFKRYEENPKLEKALEKLDEGFEDAIQYLSQPAKWHRLIRSTNSLERLNQEVRRRERVIRIFPNTQSAYRLIGAVLMDYDEEQAKKKNIFTNNENVPYKCQHKYVHFCLFKDVQNHSFSFAK
ncbi:transposase mutator type [Bacillus methanolicus PB1]|uniref:Mutator family transposase n=1 Tax=Bacillus methanolicus PB1 TaxID=997296 RepID=I3DVM0_BACMT|nr:transposase mutator type [Bacillus methanolicus PB1]